MIQNINMRPNPLVSIIVPAYNVAPYLDRCMDSLVTQDLAEIEIILIDDGSTDDTPRMCDEWGAKDERIRVVHQSNAGLAETRNRGVALATAPFIGFVDSDDWIEPDMYMRLCAAQKAHDADIVVCNVHMDFVEDASSALMHRKPLTDTSKRTTFAKVMLEKGLDCYSWNKLYRRSLFEGVRYPSGRWMEDHATTYKLYHKADRTVYLDIPLYHYIRHSASFTMTPSVAKERDYFAAVSERKAFGLSSDLMTPMQKAFFKIKCAQRLMTSVEELDLLPGEDEAKSLQKDMEGFIRESLFFLSDRKWWGARRRWVINLNKVYACLTQWV